VSFTVAPPYYAFQYYFCIRYQLPTAKYWATGWSDKCGSTLPWHVSESELETFETFPGA
jgi:hypothetical protein